MDDVYKEIMGRMVVQIEKEQKRFGREFSSRDMVQQITVGNWSLQVSFDIDASEGRPASALGYAQ